MAVFLVVAHLILHVCAVLILLILTLLITEANFGEENKLYILAVTGRDVAFW